MTTSFSGDDEWGVPRDTLHQRVATRLRQLLIQGLLAPGARLNERELCERLDVSRTPLREAIRLLTAEGLVAVSAGRGAFVPVLSIDDVTHTFDVLAVLEGLSAQLAATRVTDAELIELRSLQQKMEAAFACRDLPVYYTLNARIHDLINEVAANPVLRATWQQLNARMHALRFRSNQDESKWVHAVEEHAAMVKALEARDGEKLRLLLIAHLHRKRDAVLEQMRHVRSSIDSGGRAPVLPDTVHSQYCAGDVAPISGPF